MNHTKRMTHILGRAILAASLLVAGAGTAAGSDDEHPLDRPRTDIGIGMLVGGFGVGPVSGVAGGMHLSLGRQVGNVSLYAEWDLLSVGESSLDVADPVRGLMSRVGGNLRYNMWRLRESTDFEFALWWEGGVGRQFIQWSEGGQLARNDLSFGFGLQTDFGLCGGGNTLNVFGVSYAIKAVVARSPHIAGLGQPSCAGPCDTGTQQAPYDFGLFFNMGFEFGR